MNTKCFEETHIIENNKSIQIQVKKNKLSLLLRGPKFTPTTRNIFKFKK